MSLRKGMRLLLLLALGRLILHCATNGQYGFHRDELATLDDARHLAWGFVAYPPVTPFFGRVSLELFGPSLIGARFFPALAQSIAMVITGLIARDLGGGRWAQAVAALAAAVSPMALCAGNLLQYVTFDYLWWVLAAWLMVRLLTSGDPRWWVAIGAVLGLGMMTKYTMIFLIIGIAAGVLLSPIRSHLRSPWLWGGAGLSVMLFAPNLLWQIRHDFVSLEFLRHVHERDVAIGRADDFLTLQLYVSASLFTLPLWLAGLYFYLRSRAGVRFRPLGWMYLIPLVLFLLARGRFYYMAPAYPMLLAAGSVVAERWIASLARGAARVVAASLWIGLAAGAVMGGILMLPIAPIGSAVWNFTSEVHDNFTEQIGWQELTQEVARIYMALPPAERESTGILTGNYGEAGAINMYGPALGLPVAISGVNSYWERGYGDPPPRTLIIVGFSREEVESGCSGSELVGRNQNSYGVANEESQDHPDIFLCREPRLSWPELWKELRGFG